MASVPASALCKAKVASRPESATHRACRGGSTSPPSCSARLVSQSAAMLRSRMHIRPIHTADPLVGYVLRSARASARSSAEDRDVLDRLAELLAESSDMAGELGPPPLELAVVGARVGACGLKGIVGHDGYFLSLA